MKLSSPTPTETSRRLILAALIPLAALGLQWFFWAAIQPYVWFLFFPAVFFSSWVGGLRGGLVATVLSTGLVWCFFIPPQFSFAFLNPMSLVSIGMFVVMGVLFSLFHGRLWKADLQAAEAVAAVQAANDQLEARVLQSTAELQQTNGELRESEERFHSAMQHSAIGMALVAPDGRWLDVNRAICQIVGYTREELLATTFQTITHPDDLDADLSNVRLMLERKLETYQMEKRYLHRRGSVVWVLLSVSLVWRDDGSPHYFIAQIQDITARREVEQALRDSEAKWHALFDESSDGLILADPATRQFRIVNQTICRMLGYSAAELLVRGVADLFAPADLPAMLEAFHRHARGELKLSSDLAMVRKDGSILYADVTAALVVVNGERLLLGAIRDATERKRAEAAVRSSEERLRFALETSQTGAWDLDLVDHTAFRSLEHDRIFGYRELLPQWTYEMFLEHVLPEDRATVDETFRRATETRSDWSFECRIRRVDGAVRWIWAAGCHRPDDAGVARRMTGIVQDITERKQAEAEVTRHRDRLEQLVAERTNDLKDSRTAALSLMQDSQRQQLRLEEALAAQRVLAAQLEVANKELESFSYSVSHDLRAPLRHIQGYAAMLTAAITDQLSDKSRHYLETITAASDDMGQLIDDLLAFSRMSRIALHENRVDMDGLVREAIGSLEIATQGRNIAWKVAPLPPVLGDASMLKQVLANLLGNAAKYSRERDPAEIEIGCWAGAGEDDGRVILFVKDNGAGFDMAYAHTLFGVFQRLHRDDEFEGTGIGLAIVQRIIARHGGRTWAEGALNQGATFYCTLKPATAV